MIHRSIVLYKRDRFVIAHTLPYHLITGSSPHDCSLNPKLFMLRGSCLYPGKKIEFMPIIKTTINHYITIKIEPSFVIQSIQTYIIRYKRILLSFKSLLYKKDTIKIK